MIIFINISIVDKKDKVSIITDVLKAIITFIKNVQIFFKNTFFFGVLKIIFKNHF